MLGEIGNLLAYGGGALGVVGIVYFIIRFFLGDDSADEILEQSKKDKEKEIKKNQKEVEKLKKESDELEKKQKEVKDKIDKTVEDFKKEKEKIEKSDSIENTVNIIEKEW